MAKVVLVGYGEMLYSLIKGIKNSNHEILGVLRSERIRYNSFQLFFKDIFAPSQDYSIIKSFQLKDIKANSVNDKKFIKQIKKLNPDLIIVGSWGEKFKKEILKTVPCINFHPALLPKNRGANPYFWVIYNNQSVTGLSAHFMNEKFDKGDIILQEAITIAQNETGKSLKQKTTKLAQAMVKDVLDLFDKKQIQPIKQDEKFATYEPQISQENVVIDLNKSKEEVSRHLRALFPWSVPYVKVSNQYIKIRNFKFLELNETTKNEKPYTIVENTNSYITLKGNGFLLKIAKHNTFWFIFLYYNYHKKREKYENNYKKFS